MFVDDGFRCRLSFQCRQGIRRCDLRRALHFSQSNGQRDENAKKNSSQHDCTPITGYFAARGLEYLFAAPGVGRSVVTTAPRECGRASGVVSVMPLPASGAPNACAILSGAVSVIRAPPRPPCTTAIVAVSWLAPLSIVIDWPTTKPPVAATGMTVSPTWVAALA